MTLTQHAASYVRDPLVIDDESSVNWVDTADVVVVGYGGAGACAALQAREDGADVLVIDRFNGGGATALSGGVVYGGGTPYQRQAGIEDSPDEMFKYLKREIGDVVRDETLRRFCEQSSENFAWLVDHGVSFGTRAFDGKRSYPPKGYDIYFSGNEFAPDFAAVAKPAQRGHRVSGQGYTGKDFFGALSRSAAQKGVRLRTHSLADRMVVNSQGEVIGVEILCIPPESEGYKEHEKLIQKANGFQRYIEKLALKSQQKAREIEEKYGERVLIRARNGVVLTTGSFAFNREMVKQYAPKYGEAMPLGAISCDGSGLILGQSLGGATDKMDSVTAWRSISPPAEFVKGLVINKAGQRFTAEDVYLGHLGRAAAEQQDGRVWLVIDSQTYWRAYKETIPRFGEEGFFEFRGPLLLNLLFNSTRGKTLAQLAEKIGVDVAGLEREAATYNAGAAEGKDRFNKKKANCRALNMDSSFYAIEISIGSKKFMCPSIPMGGLCVDEDTGTVLRNDGTPIVGLYAAGRAAVGIPSGFYVSGSSLADGIFSGRRAGQHAALAKKENLQTEQVVTV